AGDVLDKAVLDTPDDSGHARRDLALAHKGLADTLSSTHRKEAEKHYRRARAILRKLVEEFRVAAGGGRIAESGRAHDHAHTLRTLAFMMPPDRIQERLTRLQQAADVFGKLAADHPDDSGFLPFQ